MLEGKTQPVVRAWRPVEKLGWFDRLVEQAEARFGHRLDFSFRDDETIKVTILGSSEMVNRQNRNRTLGRKSIEAVVDEIKHPETFDDSLFVRPRSVVRRRHVTPDGPEEVLMLQVSSKNRLEAEHLHISSEINRITGEDYVWQDSVHTIKLATIQGEGFGSVPAKTVNYALRGFLPRMIELQYGTIASDEVPLL